MAVELTAGQNNAFAITERVTSIFSLLGIFFILSTFLLGRGFDKPINRLVFAASWSNLGMNIAALIAEDGVAAGAKSSLCQFQAFAIQMLALALALIIYVMASVKVWRNRHELHGLFNPFNENPFEGTVTTEVDVTSYARPNANRTESDRSFGGARPFEEQEIPIPGTTEDKNGNDGFDPYSVNVEVGRQRKPSAPEMFRVRSLTRNAALSETNPEAWLYARVAFLFFLALLISWVPSSINRLYSLANPNKLNFGLNYTETLVLPLQGFLNAIVYVITSQTACKNLWRSMTGAQELPRKSSMVKGPDGMPLGKLGVMKPDSKLERFTSRRTSQRLHGYEVQDGEMF
ncbi:hypothetical protein P7C71_g1385, partial [Lecanoromycetidae sp. Uapishka_2]